MRDRGGRGARMLRLASRERRGVGLRRHGQRQQLARQPPERAAELPAHAAVQHEVDGRPHQRHKVHYLTECIVADLKQAWRRRCQEAEESLWQLGGQEET